MSSLFKIILVTILFFVMTGCAMSPGYHDIQVRNEKLSDAMNVAAGHANSLPQKPYPEFSDGQNYVTEQPAEQQDTNLVHIASDDEAAYEPPYENRGDDQIKSDGSVNMVINVSSIPVRNYAIHEIRETSLNLEFDENSYAFGLGFVGSSYDLNRGTLHDQAISSNFGYGWQVYVKGYMNSRSVFISPYWHVAFGQGNFQWTYKNPVVDSSGYVLDSDSVGYSDFRLGLGGELARSYGIGMTLSATAILRIYNSVTNEGFINDMFSSHFSPAFGTSLTLRY